MNKPFFSFIIPIFERQDELKELLESITKQTNQNFEVIIIDDGSKSNLQNIITNFKDKIELYYYYKINEGASIARNYGASLAKGNFFLFLDSDCILPINYIEKIKNFIDKNEVEFFGGPDDADNSFSFMQKSLSYAMTGFFTTGGIRGGLSNKNFQPRSFNMGILDKLFNEVGGFKNIKVGEDIELSLRIKSKGIKATLISDAKVFHKRRNNLQSFAKRVYGFGKMRPILINWFPATNKLVFYFPSLFLLASIVILPLSIKYNFALMPFFLWIVCLFAESYYKYRSITVSFLSIITSFIQIYAYGLGFVISYLSSFFKNIKQ